MIRQLKSRKVHRPCKSPPFPLPLLCPRIPWSRSARAEPWGCGVALGLGTCPGSLFLQLWSSEEVYDAAQPQRQRRKLQSFSCCSSPPAEMWSLPELPSSLSPQTTQRHSISCSHVCLTFMHYYLELK